MGGSGGWVAVDDSSGMQTLMNTFGQLFVDGGLSESKSTKGAGNDEGQSESFTSLPYEDSNAKDIQIIDF